jgi:hypothetical protein
MANVAKPVEQINWISSDSIDKQTLMENMPLVEGPIKAFVPVQLEPGLMASTTSLFSGKRD